MRVVRTICIGAHALSEQTRIKKLAFEACLFHYCPLEIGAMDSEVFNQTRRTRSSFIFLRIERRFSLENLSEKR